MAKNKRPSSGGRPSSPARSESDTGASLKDLLRPEMVQKLKEQAEELKAEDRQRREEERQKAEEARKAEQKRLDNDFGHLLETSKQDWRNYKN